MLCLFDPYAVRAIHKDALVGVHDGYRVAFMELAKIELDVVVEVEGDHELFAIVIRDDGAVAHEAHGFKALDLSQETPVPTRRVGVVAGS